MSALTGIVHRSHAPATLSTTASNNSTAKIKLQRKVIIVIRVAGEKPPEAVKLQSLVAIEKKIARKF